MEMDFQTIITDFGVCYTFNLDGNRSLSQAGKVLMLSKKKYLQCILNN